MDNPHFGGACFPLLSIERVWRTSFVQLKLSVMSDTTLIHEHKAGLQHTEMSQDLNLASSQQHHGPWGVYNIMAVSPGYKTGWEAG